MTEGNRKLEWCKLQRHFLLTALHKEICACAQRIFFVLVFWHRLSVGLMKSKILKVKSFYNYLTHHLPLSQRFQFFWATPYNTCWTIIFKVIMVNIVKIIRFSIILWWTDENTSDIHTVWFTWFLITLDFSNSLKDPYWDPY